jgi:methionyl aminopeptidase
MYNELVPLVQPGVRTKEIDQWVREWIRKAGGKPAFLGYKADEDRPFPGAICISINEEVIHGIPGKRKVQSGDLVSLDCGINLDGYISDQAVTVEAGVVHSALHKLNAVTKECLMLGIQAARTGGRLHEIGAAVERCARAAGYGIVTDFCGHGVGLDVHEDPAIPNVPHGPNPRLRAGMVLAIEPMINLGTGDVDILDDDWTIITTDRKPSAHWEHTIAILPDRVEVLTSA